VVTPASLVSQQTHRPGSQAKDEVTDESARKGTLWCPMSRLPDESLPEESLSGESLAEAAAAVLRANDRGDMTIAAPDLYPHQWSWDAAFVTVGLSHISVSRAVTELRTLLAGQWSTGMIPHIVFSPDSDDYFPDADRWDSSV